jgi:uncharacterized Zn finger protein
MMPAIEDLIPCPICGKREAYYYVIRGWRRLCCDACGHDELVQKPNTVQIRITLGGGQRTLNGTITIEPPEGA